MTSSRAKSPDRYIEITKDSQDRYLTKEEKRMLLNVYGVLRKEVRLSVKRAVDRAADLCGVSTSALFSAKKEFDKICESKIPNRSLDPLGNGSVQHDENNRVDTRNLPERQVCTSEIYFDVRAKILELLRISGTTTIESVVEAFQKDPHLPNLEDSVIRHVVDQLNLTSCMFNVGPQSLELQPLCNWDTSFEATGTRSEDVTTTSAAVLYCDVGSQGVVKRDPSESIAADAGERKGSDGASSRCPLEFHACASTEIKTEGEEGVKREVVDPDGIFPNRPTASELDRCPVVNNADETFPRVVTRGAGDENNSVIHATQSTSSTSLACVVSPNSDRTFLNTPTGNPEHSFDNGVNTYAVAPASRPMTDSLNGVGNQTLPFAGILVYGLNAMNASNSDVAASVPNGFHYVDDSLLGGVSYDQAGILTGTMESFATASPGGDGPKSGGKPPRDRRYRSCNVCRRMFDRRGPVCHHLAGGKGRSHLPPLVCRYCPRSFPGPGGREFVQHTMYIHTMRSLVCDFCGCSFDSAQRLVRHVSNAHMDSFLEQQGVLSVPT